MDEGTHDWLNERELYDDRPSASELEEYRGTIPPYDVPPDDEDAEEVEDDAAEDRFERWQGGDLDWSQLASLGPATDEEHPF